MNVEDIVRAASQAANAGRFQDAERLWRELLRVSPQHPQALFGAGFHALHRGDHAEAAARLQQARAVAPADILTLLTLATALGTGGDAEGAREAIDAALAVDPYFVPALLAKGAWFERQGAAREAATTYGNALRIAPPETHWPAHLRKQLEHARVVTARHAQALEAHLASRLGDAIAALPGEIAPRWREAAAILARRSRPFTSESNQLCVPRLPAIPFFERERFPWAAAVEARTDAIRAELQTALAAEASEFIPYIAYRPGDPVNQWGELNHSTRWSTYHLWRSGAPVAEHLDRCPQTRAALALVERVDIAGLCPNAMFSALAPHTQIPPHNGETNARLVVHLPLIVPAHCRYRVGFEERDWEVGRVLVFDDTIEHEARNDSDELRVVLIFDVWNPLLQPQEREMVRALAAAARSFGAG